MMIGLVLLALAAGAPPSQPALRDELLAMERMDQEALRALPVGEAGAEQLPKVIEMRTRHAARLSEIVDRHGWPGFRLVGRDGANAAWLLVQHADHDVAFQRRCLERMEKAVDAGDVSRIDVAYLTDRVLVNEGRRQIYGTQAERGPDGRYRPKPVEDEKNLDARRKTVGLGSERSYLRTLQKFESRPRR